MTPTREGRSFIRHAPCPSCGSRDNVSVYSDGYELCRTPACGYYAYKGEKKTQSDSEGSQVQRNPFQIESPTGQEKVLSIKGEVSALKARRITEATCAFWQYRVGTFNGSPAHFAHYYDPDDRSKLRAIKVRLPNKKFPILGNTKNLPLYGQWLWKPGGKKVVITEGEIDAMTMSQLQDNRWPVVSLPNGADSALQSCKQAFDWLNSFESIVVMFDMDDPGKAASKQVAELFSPGKVKIAQLPHKDASECLTKGDGDKCIRAMWEAKAYRPDGIIDGADVWDKLCQLPSTAEASYPWEPLNAKLNGLRKREIVTICSGSGMGKSTIVKEIAYHLIHTGKRVGLIMLEESIGKTARSLVSLHLNTKLHKSLDAVSPDHLRQAYQDVLANGRVYMYDHFGSTDTDNLLAKIRYMIKAFDCDFIILDHLSIVVSGIDGGDERRIIDNLMTKLRTLVEETGAGLILVSHLRRPQGQGHEEGAVTSLSQLRGSHSIAQLSDIVLGAERDQQSEDSSDVTAIRVLKDRWDGQTGLACSLYYDNDTGRLAATQLELGMGKQVNANDSADDRDF